MISILLKLFKNLRENTLPNVFYNSSINLTPKPYKDATRKENYKPVLLIDIDVKNSKQRLPNFFNNATNGPNAMIKWDLFQECKNNFISIINQCNTTH